MLKGKTIIKGEIELLSPVIIGSGKNDTTDVDVLKDEKGKAYIPATSFAGVLKHFTKKLVGYSKHEEELFWGSSNENNENKEQKQSAIRIDDLLTLDENNISQRDGVKISRKKGIAEDTAKFDYEVVETGSRFSLEIEITFDANEENNTFKKQMIATIIELLKNGEIRLGAKTNSGFGRIKLVDDYKIYSFDFTNKKDVLRWFKQDLKTPSGLNIKPLQNKSKNFTINGDFVIKNSIIVRSYNYDPNMPDIENIKSNGRPILPGTSLKGAIRSRIERIVKTVKNEEEAEKIIDGLFGYVKEKTSKKGKITVEETFIDGYAEEIQTRIKIDRFTGGTIEGALLEAKPIFSKENAKAIKLKITVSDYKDYEAGLLLLVLKDLWTGDLPIGGEKAIGRGVLEGRKAEINWDGKHSITFEDISQLEKSQKEQLQSFVEAFVNFSQGVV